MSGYEVFIEDFSDQLSGQQVESSRILSRLQEYPIVTCNNAKKTVLI